MSEENACLPKRLSIEDELLDDGFSSEDIEALKKLSRQYSQKDSLSDVFSFFFKFCQAAIKTVKGNHHATK